MRLLVVGGGAREHAIIWKIKNTCPAHEIFCAPGNAGIAETAECVNIAATDIEALAKFAKTKGIEFTIIGPDNPLSLGIVDRFQEEGLKVFGPDKKAAVIEYSKAFSKDFMKRNHIPTARYEVFEEFDEALQYLESGKYPLVVKADGLALGKGVIICQTKEEAETAVKEMMVDCKYNEAGKKIVIEEFLEGEEVSVLAFADGKTVIPMAEAQDYKKAKDGDKGLNTGGMGSFSPCKVYTEDIGQYCMDNIFKPTVAAMYNEGRPFKGVLFFGLILTKDGPKVIEYNARFGDPETQVVIPRLENDLLDIFMRCENGTLHEIEIKWKKEACVCVVAASSGYPESYETGYEITGLDQFKEKDNIFIFHAGTKKEDGHILTNGGRVLSICGFGEDLQGAKMTAYDVISRINYKNIFFRQDIATKGL